MKHATPQSLDRIDRLLEKLRKLSALKEKSLGVFYFKSRAFLHFHEDDAILYADVRLRGADFKRFRVASIVEQDRLISAVTKKVGEPHKEA